MENVLFLCVAAFSLLISSFCIHAGAAEIGINYGLLGDDLPSPDNVVALFKSRGITKIRLFQPSPAHLAALDQSGIAVVLGTLNNDLPNLANDPAFATSWVQTNVVPHAQAGTSFSYVTAGNEVIPGEFANYVLPAMQNLIAALAAANFNIPVSTVVSTSILGASYPPSQGVFSEATSAVMAGIAIFLAARNTPLLVNVYPYFAYAGQPNDVRLDYALFTASGPVVVDGALSYSNLFDAIVDAMYSALEKAGQPGVRVLVSETGWPSSGGFAATVELAKTYNENLVAHVTNGMGTPKRPEQKIEAYLFAMFNERLKSPPGIEQNFGLYYPNMTEVYTL